VLYDLAFLLMDLDHRGLRDLANVVLNRILRDGAELEALAALPLFFSVRAAIRAKVAAAAEASQKDVAASHVQRDEAKSYFAAARAYLAPPPARLLAVGGLSGSGKSTLARDLAPLVGPAPGALHLRSDVLRKRIMGAEELTRLPAEAYRPEVSRRVYDEILDRARRALGAGHAVVLDAVYNRPEDRDAVAALARDLEVEFDGLWLEAPPETLRARTAARRGDASDATPAVVDLQLAEDTGVIDWLRIETGDSGAAPAAVAACARRLLGL